MPPFIALGLCALFVLWLFVKDGQQRGNVSSALWIPLVWVFIISSRPVSLWLGSDPSDTVGYLEDHFIDKALFLFLIGAGFFVLSRRRANWRSIVGDNKWLFIYFLYLGISVLWSDDSFVSFKRWIKHFGNVVMVLVILTEKDPGEAIRAFLARCAYLMIPLSVVLTKYYPALSRGYNQFTNEPVFVGIATGKNLLGMVLFVCGLSLFWMLLELRNAKVPVRSKTMVFAYSTLLVMTAWLLVKARSATALSCTVLGAGALLGMRVPAIRNRVKRLWTWVAAVAVLIVLFQVSGLWQLAVEEFAGAVGRDPTLHGRHEIWTAVLKEDINPLIGTGFYSFWSEERNRRLSEQYYYSLGVAHNGYIETYLNNGLIGLFLLIAVIASAARGIKREVLIGSNFATLRLAFLILILLYNLSESIFDRLGIVWFILLLVMIEYRYSLEKAGSKIKHAYDFSRSSAHPVSAVST